MEPGPLHFLGTLRVTTRYRDRVWAPGPRVLPSGAEETGALAEAGARPGAPGEACSGARRGRPHRGDTGRRGPCPRRRRPAAPSAAARWGCAEGTAGRRPGSRLAGAHLRAAGGRGQGRGRGDARDPSPVPATCLQQVRGGAGARGGDAGPSAAASPWLQALPAELAKGLRKGRKDSIPIPLSRAYLGGGKKIVARTGEAPVARCAEETQATRPPPVPASQALSALRPRTVLPSP